MMNLIGNFVIINREEKYEERINLIASINQNKESCIKLNRCHVRNLYEFYAYIWNEMTKMHFQFAIGVKKMFLQVFRKT